MPWLRSSDQAGTHPLIMRIRSLRGADRRHPNEVAGFVWRCATMSSAHLTDYVIDLGTAEMLDPSGATEKLLKLAVDAGLMTVAGRGAQRRWTIVQDMELFHVPDKQDVERERQRKKDNRNPDLTMPALLRWGDQCAYCGRVVNWSDHKGIAGGTWDARGGHPVKNPDDLVVCCRGCNRDRSDDPDADARTPLRPIPKSPYFSPRSRSIRALRDHYGPQHPLVVNLTAGTHHQPVADRTGVAMEDHARTESTHRTAEAYAQSTEGASTGEAHVGEVKTHRTAEAYDADPATAPEWARPSNSSTGAPGAGRDRGEVRPYPTEVAYAGAERIQPLDADPRGEVRPYAVAEAHPDAGSTGDAGEDRDGPRKAAHRRRKRRRAHGLDDE